MVRKDGMVLETQQTAVTHRFLTPEMLVPAVLVAEAALFAIAAASGKMPAVVVSLFRALLTI